MKLKPGHRPRLWPIPARLAITLLVSLSVLVPLAYVGAPILLRRRMLGQLTSTNPQERARALSYVARRAGSDKRVLHGAVRRLRRVRDARNFIQLVNVLERADRWDRRWIPIKPWLRWLTILTKNQSNTQSRIFAAQRLGELSVAAVRPVVPRLLNRLIADDVADVRYNALTAAGSLFNHANAPGDRQKFEQMIAQATGDAQPRIARHAWILLGLIDPLHGFAADWRDAPPSVAQAMLWAVVKTNPENPAPAIAALRVNSANAQSKRGHASPQARHGHSTTAKRAAAAYALHLSRRPEAIHALLHVVNVDPADITKKNVVVVWRAILGLPTPDGEKPIHGPLVNSLIRFTGSTRHKPLLEPLRLAAIYRLGRTAAAPPTTDISPQNRLPALARLEGQHPPPYRDWRVNNSGAKTPPLLRTLLMQVTAHPEPKEMLPALDADLAPTRDLACVTAAQRFDDTQNKWLIRRCLTSPHDHARMSGAVLAGLSGLRLKGIAGPTPALIEKNPDLSLDKLLKMPEPKLTQRGLRRVDLLPYIEDHEPDWAVRQVLRLGLWMQGRRPAMGEVAASLLDRQGVPPSTVMLAMLHQGRRKKVLDFLLAPRTEPTLNLVDLFDQLRWWHVLRGYLPEDAPPFWVWADTNLERFQVDVLRDWYLLHRGEL